MDNEQITIELEDLRYFKDRVLRALDIKPERTNNAKIIKYSSAKRTMHQLILMIEAFEIKNKIKGFTV